MAFESFTARVVYPGDGATLTRAIPDKFYSADEVRVFRVVAATGVETELTQGVDFSVVITATDPTPPARHNGNVVFDELTPIGTDEAVLVWPADDQDQPFEGRPVTPRQHERVHDLHVMRSAGAREFLDRVWRTPLNSDPEPHIIVPGTSGQVLVFGANGIVVGATPEEGGLPGANSVGTDALQNGVLSADASGRAKMADGYLTEPKLAESLANVLSAACADLTALKAVDDDRFKVVFRRDLGLFYKWDASDLSASIFQGSVTSTGVSGNVITKTAHGLETGMAVVPTTSANGLTAYQKYYVTWLTADTFSLCSSFANALAATVVTLTGTDNFTVTKHTDPTEAMYVIPTGKAADGSEGAWVAQHGGKLRLEWFGVVYDYDYASDTGTDSTEGVYAALQFAEYNKYPIRLSPGWFYNSHVLIVWYSGLTVIGADDFNSYQVFGHIDANPGWRLKKRDYRFLNFTIDGTLARRATYSTTTNEKYAHGILIASDDVASADTHTGIYIEGMTVRRQAGSGIWTIGTNIRGSISRNVIQDCAGGGIGADDGTWAGYSNKHGGGGIGVFEVGYNQINYCGGEGIRIGHASQTHQPYRVDVFNNEIVGCAWNAAARLQVAQIACYGVNVQLINSGLGDEYWRTSGIASGFSIPQSVPGVGIYLEDASCVNIELGRMIDLGQSVEMVNCAGVKIENPRIINSAYSTVSSAIDTGTETITTASAHSLQTGMRVTPTASINGLTAGTDYWVYKASSTTFRLYTTQDDAKADSGSNLANLTGSSAMTVEMFKQDPAISADGDSSDIRIEVPFTSGYDKLFEGQATGVLVDENGQLYKSIPGSNGNNLWKIGGAFTNRTIASGSITIQEENVNLVGEVPATPDSLSNLFMGSGASVIPPAGWTGTFYNPNAYDITLTDGSGNLRCNTGANIVLSQGESANWKSTGSVVLVW